MISDQARRRRVIPATCTLHRDGTNFTNLVVSWHDGGIELDDHAVGACVVRLDEDGARTLFELLGEWFG